MVKLDILDSSKDLPDEFLKKILMDQLSNIKNPYGKILLNLRDYLQTYTKTFENIDILPVAENKVFSNGTLKGLILNLNRKEIGIAVQPFFNYEIKLELLNLFPCHVT